MGKLVLTDGVVKALPTPASGLSIVRDGKLRGFGVRILPTGTRAFVLDYTASGRRRTYTIGKFGSPGWDTKAARRWAENAQRRIRHEGYDPATELQEQREAPTVQELWEKFEEWQRDLPASHEDKLRPNTIRGYTAMALNDIVPELGKLKLAAVALDDINRLHQKITKRGSTYVANQCTGFLRRLFNMAIEEWSEWSGIERNPCKGHGRNQETKRRRYLKKDELPRLMEALAEHGDRQAADIIRLLLLTGARRGEVQSMRWADLDFKAGLWTKPASATKQKMTHEVPISPPVLELLACLRKEAEASAKKAKGEVSEFVFPGSGVTGHVTDIKKSWEAICRAAKLTATETVKVEDGKERAVTKKSIRIHDLRHSYASFLASSGVPLATIGALLGHSNPQTTARYSHLFPDVQRAATEKVGAIIAAQGNAGAEVVTLKGRTRR